MKKIILVLIVCAFCNSMFGQKGIDIKKIANNANLQKTANSQDILTNYFKAGIDNLLGTKHSFSFSSTFYGIDSILKIKPKNEFYARSNSFNISLKGDSSNNLSSFSGGFTFTILDKKNIVFKSITVDENDSLKDKISKYESLRKRVKKYLQEKYSKQTNFDLQEIDKSFNKADTKHDYSDLNPFIIEALKEIVNKEENEEAKELLKGEDFLHDTYSKISTRYARAALWTFSPTYAYDIIKKQASYSVGSDFTIGFGKPEKKAWEFEAKTSFKIDNDTSNHQTNYDSKLFSLSVGVNKVLIENTDKESKMELKIYTQFDQQFGSTPIGVDKNKFTFNSVFRINVYKSLWLPITINYDPKSGNVLGLFSITANIGQ